MDKIIVVILLLTIFALGFAYLRREVEEIRAKKKLESDFLGKLRVFYESRGNDEAYNWMLIHSQKLQKQLGAIGILGEYHEPYGSAIYHNYPVILNEIPRLSDAFSTESTWGARLNLTRSHAELIQQVVLMHWGVLDEEEKEKQKQLQNPLDWSISGTRLIVLLPLQILRSAGVLTTTFVIAIAQSRGFKMLSLLVLLLTILSAIMTIMLGWSAWIDMIGSRFGSK